MADQLFRKTVSHGKSVMFAVHFDDGRTAYLVIPNHGGPDQDFKVTAIAKERQRTGDLPEGVICTIKRVR